MELISVLSYLPHYLPNIFGYYLFTFTLIFSVFFYINTKIQKCDDKKKIKKKTSTRAQMLSKSLHCLPQKLFSIYTLGSSEKSV